MKPVMTKLALFAAVLACASILAATADARKLFATRAQVRAACEANNGGGWGYGSNTGDYGCVSNGGWIYCQADGSCEGGRARRPAERSGSRSRALPKARNAN
jgi:hypothetical protein